MQELCCLNGRLLELVTHKKEGIGEEGGVCIEQVFLLAEYLSLLLFWCSGLLGHSEAPCRLVCFS